MKKPSGAGGREVFERASAAAKPHMSFPHFWPQKRKIIEADHERLAAILTGDRG
jgi:hypothetical protein